MARKGLFTEFSPAPRPKETAPAPEGAARAPLMPRGAVGALQSSLARMQANAVQDVAPELIDHAGVEDRLAHDDA
ncbi:plasmid partitioning protein RepB, partial [Amaricoccus sp. HAR-UPW-R2A-40]